MHGAAIHPVAGVEGARLCTARLHGWSLSLLVGVQVGWPSVVVVQWSEPLTKDRHHDRSAHFQEHPWNPALHIPLQVNPAQETWFLLWGYFCCWSFSLEWSFVSGFTVSVSSHSTWLCQAVSTPTPHHPTPPTFPPIPLLYSTLCSFFHSSFADSLSWLVVLYNPVQVGYACTFLFFLLPPV